MARIRYGDRTAHLSHIHRRQRRLATLAMFLSATSIASVSHLYFKTPRQTSQLSGRAWLEEMFNGHYAIFKNTFGVAKHVFNRLTKVLQQHGLADSRYVELKEQLAIYLYTCVTGLSNHKVQLHFQRSADTVSK